MKKRRQKIETVDDDTKIERASLKIERAKVKLERAKGKKFRQKEKKFARVLNIFEKK